MNYSTRLASLFAEASEKIISYLNDEQINEILVNPDGKIWVDTFKDGRVDTGNILSTGERERIICLVAGMSDQIVTSDQPDVGIEIANSGERFQGMLPPLVEHPAFSIRKHCASILTLSDYVDHNCLTKKQVEIIKKSIKERKNIIICGATSSGKTTFGNAVLQEIAQYHHRVLILEDTRELQCSARDVVQLKTTHNRSMRDLIKIALRLRPDRIVVGEVRGGEALELLKAWGTGHPGGLATLHAESAQDCLFRLEDLVAESTVAKQTRLIANSVDVIIYLQRVDNRRVVKQIVEVKKLSVENSDYELNEIK